MNNHKTYNSHMPIGKRTRAIEAEAKSIPNTVTMRQPRISSNKPTEISANMMMQIPVTRIIFPNSSFASSGLR